MKKTIGTICLLISATSFGFMLLAMPHEIKVRHVCYDRDGAIVESGLGATCALARMNNGVE